MDKNDKNLEVECANIQDLNNHSNESILDIINQVNVEEVEDRLSQELDESYEDFNDNDIDEDGQIPNQEPNQIVEQRGDRAFGVHPIKDFSGKIQ